MRAPLVAAVLAAALALAAPASAQGQANGPSGAAPVGTPANAAQPLSETQPDASELELQRALRGGRIEGRITIPDATAASLIQPEGRDWRRFHNTTLAWVGGVAVLGMLGLLALFYLIRGRIRIREGWSGRTLLRFGWFERATHWLTSSSFIILALSGLNLTFGRYLIRPIVGPETFTALTQWGKYAHNYLAFPFTLGIILMFLLWVRDNIPNRLDLTWLRQGGGFVGDAHPPADRFNAGQKGVFWITVLGGGVVALSGYLLIFPFYVLDIQGQQWAHIAHGTLSVLMIAAMMAHIYIGTVGMEGGFDAMGNGRVDYNWAKEHHSLWVDKQLARAHDAVEASSGGPAVAPTSARAAGAD